MTIVRMRSLELGRASRRVIGLRGGMVGEAVCVEFGEGWW